MSDLVLKQPKYQKFVELLEYLKFDVRTYSGRGMFGTSCVAITTDDSLAKVIADILEEHHDDAIEDIHHSVDTDEPEYDIFEVLRNTSSDNMGLGMVYYWPCIRVGE